MKHLRTMTTGLGALVVLSAMVFGVPWALWHYVGWPLPHSLPSWSATTSALGHNGIANATLLKALACVVWIFWALLISSLVVEVPAAVAGRTARRRAVVKLTQPLAAALVTAVVLAATGLGGPRVAAAGRPSLAATLTGTRPRPAAVVLSGDRRPAPSLTQAPLSSPSTSGQALGSPAVASTDPASFAPSAPPLAEPPAAVTAASSVEPTVVYVVQPGDTLWGIAERQLGDPLRWQEIFALNQGRVEPDGAVLSDPNWIYAGWTLLLPTDAPSAPLTPGPISTTAPAPAPGPGPAPTSVSPSAAPTTALPPQTVPAVPAAPVASHVPEGTGIDGRGDPKTPATRPVPLPSGSVVAGSFAAGVLATVALGRLRRRHSYRYRSPESGLDLSPAPRRPALQSLRRAGSRDIPSVEPPADDDGGDDDLSVAGEAADDGSGLEYLHQPEHRCRPAVVELGVRRGNPVAVDLTDVSGFGICGPTADDVARAMIAALLVRAGGGTAEVLLSRTTVDGLLPGLGPLPGLRVGHDGALGQDLAAELEMRDQRLVTAEVDHADSYRSLHPEDPFPFLATIIEGASDDEIALTSELLSHAARLSVAILYVGDTQNCHGRLAVDGHRQVVAATPEALARRLEGAELFGLCAGEAVELLDAALANTDSQEAADSDAAPAPALPTAEPGTPHWSDVRWVHAPVVPHARVASVAGHRPWPRTGPEAVGAGSPLFVNLFGPLRVTAGGQVVRSGLRGRAKNLLAWYLLRPEGAVCEEAIEALWPHTDPDDVHRTFWRALGDLRTRLREAANQPLEILRKVGDHFEPVPEEIACDLWDFQQALSEAASVLDLDETCRLLRRAVDAYGGDLVHGSDYLWVEPVRQDLHRRALDALLRLAELEEERQNLEATILLLERAIDLDRYAEEPYRRLMTVHATHGHPGSLDAIWQLLHHRLGELDLEVEPATARLYRSLTSPSGARPQRSSPEFPSV